MPQRTRRAELSKRALTRVSETTNARPEKGAVFRETSRNFLRDAGSNEASLSHEWQEAKFSARLPFVPQGEKSCPDAKTLSGTSSGSGGARVLAVLVLAPALICFMSRKDVGHAAGFPSASRSASAGRHAIPHHVAEEWPSSGSFSSEADADFPSSRARIAFAPARYDYSSDPRAASRVYARAMFFARRYDSRPYWKARKLEVGVPTDRATADLAIEHLIPCESMGRTINRIDANGKMSYGILQFQDWNEWKAASGLGGDPDNRRDAIRMAEWAIQNGMINHWGCAQILKIQ